MKLKVIFLLSGAIGASIFTIVSLPHTMILPIPKITVYLSKASNQDKSIPSVQSKLALNEAQQEKVAKVHWEIDFIIGEILTIEQHEEYKAALNRGLPIFTAINSISISEEQRNELLSAFSSAQTEIEKILTPKQLDYIQK